MSRPVVTIAVCVLLVAAVVVLQVRVTSPGVLTYAEARLLTLAAVPAIVTIACAFWIEDGRPRGR